MLAGLGAGGAAVLDGTGASLEDAASQWGHPWSRNPAESSGKVHWEQLVCVWVRRDREPGHGGEQEPRSSLLHG